MSFLQVHTEQPSLGPEVLFSIGNFPITNAYAMSVLVIVMLFTIFSLLKKRLRNVPGFFQSMVEVLIEGMMGLLDQITGSRTITKEIFPLIGTLFLYLGVSNLMGLVPLIDSITYNGISLFRTATNDFNTTFSIALCMIILTQYASIVHFGVFGHIGKYIQIKGVIDGFRSSIGDGMISIVHFLIGLLDIISEIAKVISLSVRLFGNMYAGEMMMSVLLGALAVALPTPWILMSLLSAVIQALVFGALTAAFYSLAIAGSEKVEQEATT